jgi:hypothetical protein
VIKATRSIEPDDEHAYRMTDWWEFANSAIQAPVQFLQITVPPEKAR